MSSYEEAVDKEYNRRLREKQEKASEDVKDNSMFGREILEELGISKDTFEHEDELIR